MYKLIRISGIAVSAAMVMAMMYLTPLFAQDGGSPPAAAESADAPAAAATPAEAPPSEPVADPRDSKLVEVDWVEEMLEGGLTMVFLAILSVGLVAILLERFITLRRKNFMPPGLLAEVRPMFAEKRYDEIIALCDARKSPMAEIITRCVNFRATNFDIVSAVTRVRCRISTNSHADRESVISDPLISITRLAGVSLWI